MSKRVTIEITATGARVVGDDFKKIGDKLDNTKAKAKAFGDKVSKSISGIIGVLAGLGAGMAVKRVLDYETALGKLQAKMVMATPDMRQLSESILSTGTSYGIAKEDVLGALMVFQNFGGKVEEGRLILDELAKTAEATSTPMTQLADIAATFINAGMAPKDVVAVVQTLSSQADAATVSMEDLSRVIANVASVAGGFGSRFQGAEGAVRMGAALQVAGAAFAGNAEQSKTATIAMMADLMKNAKALKKLKINVFDKDGMRDLSDIMTEIEKVSGGRLEKMTTKKGGKGTRLFGQESLGAVGAWMKAIADLRGGGGVLKAVAGAGPGKIDAQFNLRMNGIAKEAEQVQTALRELDAELMRSGGKLVRWIANDLPSAMGLAISGALTLKLAGPVTSAVAGLKGVGAIAGVASAGLAPLIGAAAIGYALGTAFDELTGASDWLANLWFDFFHPGAQGKRDLARDEVALLTTTATKYVKPVYSKSEPGFLTKPKERGRRADGKRVKVNVSIVNTSGVDGLKVERGPKQ